MPKTENEQILGHSILCIGEAGPDANSVHFAETIVEALNYDLALLHVPKPGKDKAEVGQVIAETIDILDETPELVQPREGSFESFIQKQLDHEHYQLIILGATKGSAEKPLTARSRRLASTLADSVLVLRDPPEKIKKILICTGGHPASNLVIDTGIRLAEKLNASATILHVVTSSPTMYTGLDAFEEKLETVMKRDTPLAEHLRSAAARAETAGIDSHIELRHGMVTEEILRASDVDNYDLTVIGSHEPNQFFQRLTMGRIGPQLVSSIQNSILIVRLQPEDTI
jgi:nucleotide-binding universal stress UspA family protein